MTRDEVKTLMATVAAVYQNWKVSSTLVDVWFATLQGWTFENGQNAVKAFLAAKNDFPPTPGHINALCEQEGLPASLKMSASEAITGRFGRMLLVDEAKAFADTVVPEIAGNHQFDSIEEMHKAFVIRDRTWEREFKNRFQNQQQKALTKVRQGMLPKQAILEVVSESRFLSLPDSLKKELAPNPKISGLIDSVLEKVKK